MSETNNSKYFKKYLVEKIKTSEWSLRHIEGERFETDDIRIYFDNGKIKFDFRKNQHYWSDKIEITELFNIFESWYYKRFYLIPSCQKQEQRKHRNQLESKIGEFFENNKQAARDVKLKDILK